MPVCLIATISHQVFFTHKCFKKCEKLTLLNPFQTTTIHYKHWETAAQLGDTANAIGRQRHNWETAA